MNERTSIVYVLLGEFGSHSEAIIEVIGTFSSIEAAVLRVQTLPDDSVWLECEVLQTNVDSDEEPRLVKAFTRWNGQDYRGPFTEMDP